MNDLSKLQKLLNLCSSPNDAEALAALRQAQKLSPSNLGDLIVSVSHSLSDSSAEDHFQKIFAEEAEKLISLKERFEEQNKKLQKRERDVTRLKRENKDLSSRLEESVKERSAAAESSAKSQRPGEYEILEKLYEDELVKNDRLKMQLAERDKSVKKGMRDVSKLKRGKGSEDGRVEELEKMVNDLALEVMDYRDRERARGNLQP